ncbi:hypothetical protein CGJ02_25185 [Vibrio parahaemolyticus]|nr:hypothetical protein CGJ02_25185 [Vibrio parahaemolyticus]
MFCRIYIMNILERVLPFEINNRKFRKTFESPDDFTDFLDEEITGWSKYLQRSEMATSIHSFLRTVKNDISRFNNSSGLSNSDITTFKNKINGFNLIFERDYNGKVWISSDDDILKKMLEISDKHGRNVERSFFEMTVISTSMPLKNRPIDAQDKLGAFLGVSYIIGECEYRSLLTDKKEDVDEIQARLLEQEKEFYKRKDDFFASAKSKREELEYTYQEHLKMSKPASYWHKVSTKFETRARSVFALLSIVIFLGIVAFFNFYNSYLIGQSVPVDFTSIKGVILFFTGVAIYTYFIRILSKLLFSSIHLQVDAEEREQLVYLYLSLIHHEGNKFENDSRNIILQALFSRSDTGLLSGDSTPTMPVSDIFKEFRKMG